MKRVNCEGVGDDDGFFEVEVSQSATDMFVAQRDSEAMENAVKYSYPCFQLEEKVREELIQIAWSESFGLVMGDGILYIEIERLQHLCRNAMLKVIYGRAFQNCFWLPTIDTRALDMDDNGVVNLPFEDIVKMCVDALSYKRSCC